MTTDKTFDVLRWAKSQIGRPFQWGRTDCAALAIDWVRDLSGQLIECGWCDAESARLVASVLLPSAELRRAGWLPIEPASAQPGDILVIPSGVWPECLHIVLGRTCLTADLERGPALCRTSAARRLALSAWRAP